MTTPSQFIKGIKEEFSIDYSDEDEQQTKRCSQSFSQNLIIKHISEFEQECSDLEDDDLEELNLLSQQIKEKKTKTEEIKPQKKEETSIKTEKVTDVEQNNSPIIYSQDFLEDSLEISTPVKEEKIFFEEVTESSKEKVKGGIIEKEEDDEDMLDSQTELALEKMEKEIEEKRKSQEKENETEEAEEDEIICTPISKNLVIEEFKKPENKSQPEEQQKQVENVIIEEEEENEELEIAEKLLSSTQNIPNLSEILQYQIKQKEEPQKKKKYLNSNTENPMDDVYQLDLEEIMLTEDQENELQQIELTQKSQSVSKSPDVLVKKIEKKIKEEKLPNMPIQTTPKKLSFTIGSSPSSVEAMKHTPSSSTSKTLSQQKKRKREQKSSTKFKKLKFDDLTTVESSIKNDKIKENKEIIKEDKMEEEIIQFETPPTSTQQQQQQNKESQISEFSLTPPISQPSIPSQKDQRVLLFNHFGSLIYQRAHHYFEDGRIFEMELKKINEKDINIGELKGKCFGSENQPYEPKVAFNGEFQIQKANCNCPYKINCKHCCALLFSYFDSIEQEMPLRDNLKSKLYVSNRKIENLQKEYSNLQKEFERLNSIVNRQKNEGKKKLNVKLRKVLKMNLDQWPFFVQFE